jgi:hypothetical protein
MEWDELIAVNLEMAVVVKLWGAGDNQRQGVGDYLAIFLLQVLADQLGHFEH